MCLVEAVRFVLGLLLLRKSNKCRIDFKVCRAQRNGKSRKVKKLVDSLVELSMFVCKLPKKRQNK